MGDVIKLDFKKLKKEKGDKLIQEAIDLGLMPSMKWTKDEISDSYEEETDPLKYNGQCYYDFSVWVSSPFSGEDSL